MIFLKLCVYEKLLVLPGFSRSTLMAFFILYDILCRLHFHRLCARGNGMGKKRGYEKIKRF